MVTRLPDVDVVEEKYSLYSDQAVNVGTTEVDDVVIAPEARDFSTSTASRNTILSREAVLAAAMSVPAMGSAKDKIHCYFQL